MFLYFPVRQFLYHPDIGHYKTYGIAAFSVGRRGLRRAGFVSDVTLHAGEAARLALKCTFGQLAPMQLADVVDDFLCE